MIFVYTVNGSLTQLYRRIGQNQQSLRQQRIQQCSYSLCILGTPGARRQKFSRKLSKRTNVGPWSIIKEITTSV